MNGSIIKKHRKDRGLSQEQLAAYIGITRQTLLAIENEKRGLTLEEAVSLVKLFDSMPVGTGSYQEGYAKGRQDVLSECENLVEDSPMDEGTSFSELGFNAANALWRDRIAELKKK